MSTLQLDPFQRPWLIYLLFKMQYRTGSDLRVTRAFGPPLPLLCMTIWPFVSWLCYVFKAIDSWVAKPSYLRNNFRNESDRFSVAVIFLPRISNPFTLFPVLFMQTRTPLTKMRSSFKPTLEYSTLYFFPCLAPPQRSLTPPPVSSEESLIFSVLIITAQGRSRRSHE